MYVMDKSFLLFSHICQFPRGTIFFAEDCLGAGLSPMITRYYLSALAEEGRIARLARGVFYLPELTEHGMKMRMPTVDQIAEAIARRSNVRIAPCEDQCAYLAGLTTLQAAPYDHITDGAARVIHLQNGRTLRFIRRTEARIFAIRSPRMQRLTLGMRALGRQGIGLPEKVVIKENLNWVSQEDFEDALWKTTEWVRDLLLELRG